MRQAAFANGEASFQQLLDRLGRHRPEPTLPLHACLEATGNGGLDLADARHANAVGVSVVHPARLKA